MVRIWLDLLLLSSNCNSFNIVLVNTSDSLIGPSFSRFVGLIYIVDPNHWGKSFERGIADFLPLLQLGSNAKVGLVDYIIKIFGGVLIFSVIAISLRRRFRH